MRLTPPNVILDFHQLSIEADHRLTEEYAHFIDDDVGVTFP